MLEVGDELLAVVHIEIGQYVIDFFSVDGFGFYDECMAFIGEHDMVYTSIVGNIDSFD